MLTRDYFNDFIDLINNSEIDNSGDKEILKSKSDGNVTNRLCIKLGAFFDQDGQLREDAKSFFKNYINTNSSNDTREKFRVLFNNAKLHPDLTMKNDPAKIIATLYGERRSRTTATATKPNFFTPAPETDNQTKPKNKILSL